MPLNESHLITRLTRLQSANQAFRATIADPLSAAMMHRVPVAAAQIVWAIPIEAAAAGLTIELVQDEHAWCISLRHQIDDDLEVHTAGVALSMSKALFQLVEATKDEFKRLEAECNRELTKSTASVKAVA